MYKGTIENPEAIENARNNFTKVVIELYKEGKFNLTDDDTSSVKERKAANE
jgi:hypothetical protein